jgi:transcriptional regulator with XRE-family HTH domain
MSAAETNIDGRIGTRIRGLRAERALTLDTLAERADVSRAMLSRIERGESSPTAHLLNKVCGGLGITLSVLFADAEAPARPLARRRSQPTWRDPASGYVRRSVSPPGTGSAIDIVEIDFPPGRSVAFGSQRLTSADQHVWVLDGMLELAVGDETHRLDQGDCLFMRFDKPVMFRNPTRRRVRYAIVISHGTTRP